MIALILFSSCSVTLVEKGEFIRLFQGCFKGLVKPFFFRCDTSVIPKSD